MSLESFKTGRGDKSNRVRLTIDDVLIRNNANEQENPAEVPKQDN